MRKLYLTIIAAILVSPALGDHPRFDISSLILKNGKSNHAKGVCSIPKLTPQQLYIFKEIQKIHFTETKKMRDLLARQEKAYRDVLDDARVEKAASADLIAARYFKTKFKLSKGQSDLLHTVLYKVLVKDQRPDLIRCL